jgi:hypothetical protein
MTYSSGQKFLNDHSIWHNFFVSQSIDLKFKAKLHITIVFFLAKNWKVWCFLAKVMVSRVSLSKSKVSKRSGFWVSRKVKTWIDRVFWLNLYLFKFPELISRKKWPPGPEAVVPRAIQGNRSYHELTDQFNVSNGPISNIMKLFIALGGELHRFATKKLQIATPK